MNEVEEYCREHFNEPILVHLEVARVIGYSEDEDDMYIILKYPRSLRYPEGKIIHHTAVGGYHELTKLKGQNYVKANNGEDWDDFFRLDSLLELNGAPEEKEFIVQKWDGKNAE